jgi:hypothetical protein
MDCEWCGAPFEPRQDGGSAQRFCSRACRAALHKAARRWALALLAGGYITADNLRQGRRRSVYAQGCSSP